MMDHDSDMERDGYSPHTIMLRQIDRFLRERASGSGGAESLRGLVKMVLASKRDDYFDADLERIRDSPIADDRAWLLFEAVLRLLRRHGIWDLKGRREIPRGEELLAGIE